jgi:hypothetical protein
VHERIVARGVGAVRPGSTDSRPGGLGGRAAGLTGSRPVPLPRPGARPAADADCFHYLVEALVDLDAGRVEGGAEPRRSHAAVAWEPAARER